MASLRTPSPRALASLFVIARNSRFTHKKRAAGISSIKYLRPAILSLRFRRATAVQPLPRASRCLSHFLFSLTVARPARPKLLSIIYSAPTPFAGTPSLEILPSK
jgi:hypothetical protein